MDKLKSKTVEIDHDNVPHFRDGFVGTGIKAGEVAEFRNGEFKNGWDKIIRIVGPTKN